MEVIFYGALAETANIKSFTAECSNVSALIEYIKKQYGLNAKKQAKASLILVDGKSISYLQGFKTKLTSQSTVKFMPICGGG